MESDEHQLELPFEESANRPPNLKVVEFVADNLLEYDTGEIIDDLTEMFNAGALTELLVLFADRRDPSDTKAIMLAQSCIRDNAAMARIVGDGLSGTCGVIETSIRRVSCEYTGNIEIRSKSGTSSWWFGLHIDDVANYGAVSAVKLRSSGGSSWDTVCTKDNGPSFWICSGGFALTAPISVQLTNENGESVSCDGCIGSTAGDTEWDFGTNFGGSVESQTHSLFS